MEGTIQRSEVRAFAAACLPDELLGRIQWEQERLATQCDPTAVRWTRSDQLHLTLRFYGNVRSEDLPSLKAGLESAVAGTSPLSLTARGLGCFPSPERPNVIWIGLEGDVGPLEKLQAAIERETAAFSGHSEERRFHAHLTIGRVKAVGPAARRMGEVIRSARVGAVGAWEVREITLMQSRLSPAGASYTALGRFPLGRV
jgi:RNA 2',3'-cyclic 3'-phosphodiesterase